MNLKPWAATAVLTLLSLLGAPAAHAAESDAGVIRVDGCATSKARPEVTFIDIFGIRESQQPTPAMLLVDFANESASAVTAVDFGLFNDGKLVSTVRDTGMIAPKARVMRAFSTSGSAVPDRVAASSCVPLRVQYADGTSWMNPHVPDH